MSSGFINLITFHSVELPTKRDPLKANHSKSCFEQSPNKAHKELKSIILTTLHKSPHTQHIIHITIPHIHSYIYIDKHEHNNHTSHIDSMLFYTDSICIGFYIYKNSKWTYDLLVFEFPTIFYNIYKLR